jgi:DUF1009 family protein
MSAGAPARDDTAPLAIVCGGGSLPLTVADSVSARGRRVVLFPLRGAADPRDYARRDPHWIQLAQFGAFERMAREAGCRDVVLIGSLVRPAFWQLRFDWVKLWALPRIAAAYRGGDDYLLSNIGKFVEQRGFRLLGAHEVAPEILVPEGVLGRVGPSEQDRADIALGLNYLRAAGSFDIGQGVVVAGLHIIAVEAAEGTDGMLTRVVEMRANGRVRASGGVLVKAAKPGQDRRFDLPSIGPVTVERAVAAGLAGIAVAAGDTIIAEPDRVITAADRGGIFVTGVSAGLKG